MISSREWLWGESVKGASKSTRNSTIRHVGHDESVKDVTAHPSDDPEWNQPLSPMMWTVWSRCSGRPPKPEGGTSMLVGLQWTSLVRTRAVALAGTPDSTMTVPSVGHTRPF